MKVTLADFRDPAETLVEVISPVDDLGRVQFVAYWRDDYLPPAGVRGQVFYARLDEFAARRPGPVRVLC